VHAPSQRALALVGPGRAGTTIAAGLVARGWVCVGVAGRTTDAPSALRAATRLGAPAVATADVGCRADLVIIGTPDGAIAATAVAVAPRVRRGATVLHLSGACGLAELEKLRVDRPDVEIGSLHPLQSLPSVDTGLARLPGSWCAIEGPASVERLALSLGMRPFRVEASERARYHAAATIASNHLVALLGQATRIAGAAGVPPEALLPLIRSTLDNVEMLGPAAALTGPVARGDADTVSRHVDALEPDERSAYRALAEQALRLTGRDDPAVTHALEEPV
jgi:predicted short-subunit dehydrogenase-like oxidoreductase (DUF2520 family)